ncbi:MAG: ATP-binding protein [Myxococcales bacterium]|nr:ATP-binding protein [Myxococcales bacterium]
MLPRPRHVKAVRALLRRAPVVAILGPRQSGKTTLATLVLAGRATRFDLEDPRQLDLLARDPMLALSRLRGVVVLDEIQRRPELFPVLRVLADRARTPARFLILGSATAELMRQSSESLAGRIAYHELRGLALDEVPPREVTRLWRRGGFPRSLLARSEAASVGWREDFVRTFLERDIPAFGLRLPSATLFRFWSMLAHYHAQIWNGAELARAFGMTENTVRSYLDVLTQTFMVRQLLPWHENLGKRQVKAPKIYLSDTGILHGLLGIRTNAELERHPKVGASWEGFALEQIVTRLGLRPERCFFWSTHQGAELDLFVTVGGRRVGFEIKRTTTPRVSKSMRIAAADLRLDRLYAVYDGEESYPLGEGIHAVPVTRLFDDVHV